MSANLFSRWIRKALSVRTAQQRACRGERRGQQGRRSRLLLELLETRDLPSATIFTVNTTADSGAGSLRQALLDANANPGSDIIQFNIGGGGVQSIQPLSQLPDITDPVTIDGTSQPGYSGTPLIELNGINAGTGFSAFGLHITAGNCTVRGLAIDQFAGPGIQLLGGGNLIVGNYIGTDANGDAGLGNGWGVEIFDSSGNTIGGTAPGDGNVISGSTYGYGIDIQGNGATGNLVQGNLIGTTVNGAAALAHYAGVVISSGATNNIIGGTTAAARNIISGNNYLGIWITDAGTSNNVIEGNYVGTDVTGEAVVPNLAGGIGITAGANGNRIGTDGTGSPAQMQAERNVIAGNNQPSSSGVGIGGGCSNNVVAGNYIGTDAMGTLAMPFQFAGISIGGDNNFIGTTAAGVTDAATRNVVSSGYSGIYLGGSHNVVAGNFIGTDASGMHANLIGGYGIYVDGTSGGGQYNQIGTNGDGVNDAAEGNVIDSAFMDIRVDAANFNVIAGNLIGTDVTGTKVLAANSFGIQLAHGAHDNRIGASASDIDPAAERNVISGHNIAIESEGYANLIAGNLIGSDITGLLPLGNNGGIDTFDSDSEILDNLISAASGGELGINGNGNVVAGNLIGTDITGTVSLGGGGGGVGINQGASNNTIGGTVAGARNIISGNAAIGVGFFNGATGNVVEGNYIGTDITGTKALGNGGDGVHLDGTSDNTIGGTTAGAGNIIAYNNSDGVFLNGGSSNSILGNSIHDNGGLGISFHGGANNNQAAPVLLSAVSSISGTAISGTLAGSPSGVRIELFSNQSPDPSGFGEGQTFLGFATTDAQGNFAANLPAALQPGTFLSATATDVAGDTSEFAADIVVKAALTVTVNNVSKTYGQNNPPFSVSYSGFVNGDSPSSLGGSLIYTTTATSASPVGAYPVTPSGLTSSNYTITFGNGTLTVTPAPLTVTNNNASKTYGDPNPALTGTLSGFRPGDNITASYSTSATQFSDVVAGGYPITATLNDPNGRLSNYSVTNTPGTLTINQANQTISWATPADILWGTPLGATQLNATAQGVSGGSAPGTLTYNPASGTVLAAGSGQTLTVTAAATQDYNQATASVKINVNNAAPTVGAIAGVTGPVQLGTGIVLSAPFTDPNVVDTHTALWNWGDGSTPSAGAVSETNGSGSASGSHTYAATGVYTVTLTVTDHYGATGQSTFQYAVIYDSSGGFVTGGGWINSPAGAYVANPSLTGKANFGFDSRYKKGASVPTGNTQFSFQVGNLDFHSTSYDWLVVAGAKAQYKGSGQINGAGNDAFMLTAIDGALPGGHGQDTFRIKIWDKTSGNTIYDNQLGASDTSDPTTVLGGGSIVIHSSNQLLNEAPLEGAKLAPLTVQQLQPIEEEAVHLWVAAGADPASFQGVQVSIVDLPGSGLGLAAADTIWIDKDAAGHGWFIDSTPSGSSGLGTGASDYLSPGHPALPGSPAYGKVDLLTVVTHELGHVLGYEDAGSDGLMAEYLGTGVRRVPALSLGDAKAAESPHGPGTILNRSLPHVLHSSSVPTGSIDPFFALLGSPQDTRSMGALVGEEAVPVGAPIPPVYQPPVLVAAKANAGWVPLVPAAHGRKPSTRVLDSVFADLGDKRLDHVFEDSLAVWATH